MKKILFTLFSLFVLIHLNAEDLWVPPVLSLIFPGGGQVYNKDYLKAGIFAAAEITTAAVLYKEFKSEGERTLLYRDILAGVILFSILDAYVSKELKEIKEGEVLSDTLPKK
ncbi:MAG: hypothetical protein AB7T10_00840 [bacterium]